MMIEILIMELKVNKINIWTQALKGGKARCIYHSNSVTFPSALAEFALDLNKSGNVERLIGKGKDAYWYGYKLFDNEKDANKEIFDINKYGR
jgi:hypothetical protein